MKRCFWVRWELNRHIDNSQELSDRLKHHLAICDCCNAYFQKLQKVNHLLSRKYSLALSSEQHQNLQRKILTKMSTTFSRSKPIRFQGAFRWIVGSAVAAGILLSVAIFNSSLPRDMAAEPPFGMDPMAVFGYLSFAEREMMIQHPLEREIQNLDKDLAGALAFLSDCMPIAIVQMIR